MSPAIVQMTSPDMNQGNIALIVALIAFLGQMLSILLRWWLKPHATTDLQSGIKQKKGRIIIIILTVVVFGVNVWLFALVRQGTQAQQELRLQLNREQAQSEKHEKQCQAALADVARSGLRAALSGMHKYILNDIHWPSKPPLNVPGVHGSIATQRTILEDALSRFALQIELVDKVVGPGGGSHCADAIEYSNKVRERILIPLQKKPSDDQAELIQLKRDLLDAFDALLKNSQQ